jgi:hypothetical protein
VKGWTQGGKSETPGVRPSRQELGKTRVHASKWQFLSVYTRVEISGRVNTNISAFFASKPEKSWSPTFLVTYTHIIFVIMP